MQKKHHETEQIENVFLSITGSLVQSMTPNQGSLCGETRILIRGEGFSKDNINEGNKVRLVSSSMSYDCPVNKDGTTEEDILCFTKYDL